jgi:peptidyl-prolyl cis-trans isomerase C/foldase protein PrsA
LQREVTRVRLDEDARADGERDAGSAESSSSPGEIARAVLGPLIERQILAARARAEGIQVSEADVQRATDALAASAAAAGQSFGERLKQDGETAAALHDETRERLLAERAIAQELKVERPGSAEIKAYAEAHKSELSLPEEVRAAQILVASPEDAAGLLDQLRAGARFDVLAREHSLSPDARQGGDLGFFPKGVMPPPFDEVCFSLKPGQLSGVVRSSYGFHIFKLLEKRPARRRTLDEVAPAIEGRLLRARAAEAESALVAALRAKAQVSIDEAVLAQIR